MPTLSEQIIPRRKLLLMASETAIFTGVLFLGSSIGPLATREVLWLTTESAAIWSLVRGLLTCLTISILCQASLSYNDLYDWKVSQNRSELPLRLLHSAGYALLMFGLSVILLPPATFFFPGLDDARAETWSIILLLLIAFALVWCWRAAFHWFFYKWNFGERVLIVGSGPQALGIAQMIHENPVSGYECIGLVGKHPSPPDAPQCLTVLGKADELGEISERYRVARVVVALEERRGHLPVSALLEARMQGVLVEEREAMYERIAGKIAVESLRPSYLIFNRGFTKDPVGVAIKRMVDIATAVVGLLLSLPISLAAAIAVKATSRGPVFFMQERIGQNGMPFTIIKFRTMTVDAEKHSGPVWARSNDNRVTAVGKFLRKTRIDEIPQMFNVLMGQMSFVGPRPERPFFVEQLAEAIPYYPLRHTVKPGVTGWAQVRYPYGASVEDAAEKLRYDLYYIKNMNVLFDINILMRTVGVILFGKGAR